MFLLLSISNKIDFIIQDNLICCFDYTYVSYDAFAFYFVRNLIPLLILRKIEGVYCCNSERNRSELGRRQSRIGSE
jgi:hypothetical protein